MGNPFAEAAWRSYHGWISLARTAISQRFGGGLLFDIHGQSMDHRSQIGYCVRTASIDVAGREWSSQSSSWTLSPLEVVQQSSVQAWLRPPLAPSESFHHQIINGITEQLRDSQTIASCTMDRSSIDYAVACLWGDHSLGAQLESQGFACLISDRNPFPNGDFYFNGGYTTKHHSQFEDGIACIQMETAYRNVRSSDEQMQKFGHALAVVAVRLVNVHTLAERRLELAL